MTDELVFYTNPMSRGRMVRWMLEEVGQPYRTVLLDYATTMKDAAYRAINPMAKVPTVVHGDVVVTEVAAICAYLADAFPEAELAPPHGSPDRAAYYRWLFFAAGCVDPALSNLALGVTVPDDKRAMVGYGSFAETIDALEGAVAGRSYIAGDRFSAVDVYVGSQIGWGMMFKSIDPRPAFVAYTAGLRERPAAIRAAALDDAELPAEMRAGA